MVVENLEGEPMILHRRVARESLDCFGTGGQGATPLRSTRGYGLLPLILFRRMRSSAVEVIFRKTM